MLYFFYLKINRRKYINRKIELGVLDENIITTELASALKDIQSKKLTGINGIMSRLSNNVIIKNATKEYAGGDHLWRLYVHEFVENKSNYQTPRKKCLY